VTHRALDHRRHGHSGAGPGQELRVAGGYFVEVDEVDVAVEQPGVPQRPDGGTAGVHGDRYAQASCGMDRSLGFAAVPVLHPENGQAGGDRDRTSGDASREGLVVGVDVADDGADAGGGEGVADGVGVCGGRRGVAPVEDGGDARVERFGGTEEGGQLGVGGRVRGEDRAEQRAQVVEEGHVGADPAQRRLPDVAVAVDEARHDDHAGGVDDGGAGWGGQAGCDRGDHAAVDQHVGVG
jgi:hypothetical protein